MLYFNAQYVSIQVFGSGGSANLTTATLTPKASTYTYSPSSSYDGYSSVTVQGDSNLISSNIVSRKSIFGVNGSYSPIPLIEHEMAKFTAYCSIESGTRGKAWYISGTIPEKDDNSVSVDLNKVAAVAIWTDAIPNNGYNVQFFHHNIVESISSSQIKFFSYPYITINKTDETYYSKVYFSICM